MDHLKLIIIDWMWISLTIFLNVYIIFHTIGMTFFKSIADNLERSFMFFSVKHLKTNLANFIWSNLTVTKSGVTPDPRMVPIGVDIPMTAVAKWRSLSLNHWWLILVVRHATKGAPMPLRACPHIVSQYQAIGSL